ncbi:MULTISPECIES: 3-keto-5-aminohexanoate cleavage protein [unclassified Burkholderia]|uniref:3-keto-5-aminohexanoate cleavage protein n=1 Tax=unclassified Burkholderia TaxID=2613784 RepID=UPI000F58541B|nr:MULTISPECIES: 3-keto-5-aminohexanoate cleavage protein [unclassified Burkholderia]RQR70947.1 3-keto-5-aminohexanoate cleavage protein [Burkholderia sp. Bp9011]RQR83710.1 3-keto-5-aminohexanoate cleavage protein [Burkholderia sp. Bp9010]RQS64411.1 3-keto-5-aminohexanoate cleavage protein [Burkholderia sp. Bp8977]
MSKAIITCAVTGGAHTPSMSEFLPVTPEQIAAESIAAAEAGAAIIHLHARDPETGRPSGDPALFRRFVSAIKSSTDAVINISTGGGGPNMVIAERAAAGEALKPEMCSLNMGSINLVLSEMAERDRAWRHDWEVPFLQATRGLVFRNTFEDIEWILEHVGRAGGTRFEFECYDVGHLYTLHHFLESGLVKPPLFIQSVFGLRGAMGAHVEDLLHQKRTADRLFGNDYHWSVLAAGKHQMPLATMSSLMGGNVRVGLEDSLYIGRGQLARSNADQVRKIRRILDELGIEIATPDEARAMLDLKGADQVGF